MPASGCVLPAVASITELACGCHTCHGCCFPYLESHQSQSILVNASLKHPLPSTSVPAARAALSSGRPPRPLGGVVRLLEVGLQRGHTGAQGWRCRSSEERPRGRVRVLTTVHGLYPEGPRDGAASPPYRPDVIGTCRLSSTDTSERHLHFRDPPVCPRAEQSLWQLADGKGRPGGAWSTQGGPATGLGSCSPHQRGEGTPCFLNVKSGPAKDWATSSSGSLWPASLRGKAWSTALTLA